MKTGLTRTTNYQQRVCVTEDKLLDTYGGGSYESEVMDNMMMEIYLGYLTKNQQAVIKERYINDCSLEETAKRLGISVGLVNNRTRDAINKLRKILKGEK